MLLTVCGQWLVERSMTAMGPAPGGLGAVLSCLVKAVMGPFVLVGLVCAWLAAFSWMAAVSRCDLGFAYPFMGLAIVLALAVTPFFFGERVLWHQWRGVGIIGWEYGSHPVPPHTRTETSLEGRA